LFYTSQIAAQVEDALVDQPLNKDKWAYPCTAFFLNLKRLIR
jgi:hypothetical protein